MPKARVYVHEEGSRGMFPEKPLKFRASEITRNEFTCISTNSEIGYHKIPKISPGACIFQRPFLRGLFLEGLIFEGAYLRREICVSKSIGLAL